MNAEVHTDFRPLTSLTEQIAAHLSHQIVTGNLSPGERVQEQTVARALGVSRGSVREALLLLERRHLIDNMPRRGAAVSTFSRRQLDDLFDLLEALHTMIGRKMAELWDEDDHERFTQHLTSIEAATRRQDVDGYAVACEDLVRTALALIRNHYLQTVFDSLQPLTRRALHRLASLNPDLLHSGARCWRRWYEAVAAGDPQGVTTAIHACFDHHRATLLRTIEL